MKLLSLRCLSCSPLLASKTLHLPARSGRWMAVSRGIFTGFMRTDSWEGLSQFFIIRQWLATVHISQQITMGKLLVSRYTCCLLHSCLAKKVGGRNLRVGMGNMGGSCKYCRWCLEHIWARNNFRVGIKETIGMFGCSKDDAEKMSLMR